MAIVWVSPKKKHNELGEFHSAKIKAQDRFNMYGKTIYICLNNFALNSVGGENYYFTLNSKEISRNKRNFELRVWYVVAIIL